MGGSQLRQDVNDAVDQGALIILIDCKAIAFMDSSGLGTLVIALKKIREINGRFALCSINDQVKMLLNLTNMDSIFEIYTSQDEFRQAVLMPQ